MGIHAVVLKSQHWFFEVSNVDDLDYVFIIEDNRVFVVLENGVDVELSGIADERSLGLAVVPHSQLLQLASRREKLIPYLAQRIHLLLVHECLVEGTSKHVPQPYRAVGSSRQHIWSKFT